ncbi:Stk1 family PASTA domain-containing Ser/Thr kinase [Actinomyces minihominis]|uniref:Stk1 family PASTA domain-containing Ser/Thr kinase n=1 Tax=Actinomyces minihominis TaxID=2002838 RepID=UPI000C086F85|nr:Stk1 family PASTA domain-containing Ser/Thr kinase [Actinomyces minihominis]
MTNQQATGHQGASSLTDPLINMMIDERYRVISRMARGGMATVYVARDERLDRLVALKVMHPHLAESEQFTARFRREARSAAKISHPRIVPIYDQGVVEGQGYLVMELIEGGDLRSFIRQTGPLTLEDALDISEQILEGLSAAHRAGVIHRDLKPENVLIDTDGTVRIVDFGLARAASEVSLSTTGSIMGTVAYLAPEVALNGGSDSRTDIFALGVMLYEMLTADLPGENDNPVQVALSRVSEDIPLPSHKTEWLPVEVDELVSAFCSRNPVERPASSGDAIMMLRHTREAVPGQILRRELPQTAGSEDSGSEVEITVPISRQGRTSVLPVQELVVHTSGAIAAPDSPHMTARSRGWLIITTIILLIAALGLGTWWWWQQYGPGAYLQVPDVAGMTVVDAEAILSDANMASIIIYDNSDSVAEGYVIETDPTAGQSVHKSEDVQITVSKGVLMLDVPDVSGLKPGKAESALSEEGLGTGRTIEEWSEDVPAGTVIGTVPEAGRSVRHDTSVDIIVSQGRQPMSVPQVVDTPREEAEAAIESANLQVEVAEEYNYDIAEGNVVTQSPAGGETLFRGDSVRIVISKGPEYVSVPDVYGRSEDEARQILEGAGFKVEVNRIAGFFSIVGSQSPGGGELQRRGSTVTITVV